jgi:hypothetical protein
MAPDIKSAAAASEVSLLLLLLLLLLSSSFGLVKYSAMAATLAFLLAV